MDLEGSPIRAEQLALVSPAAGSEQGMKARRVGRAHESVEPRSGHRLERLTHERRESRIAIHDVARDGKDDGAFLHLFDEVAVRLIDGVQRVDLIAVAGRDD